MHNDTHTHAQIMYRPPNFSTFTLQKLFGIAVVKFLQEKWLSHCLTNCVKVLAMKLS